MLQKPACTGCSLLVPVKLLYSPKLLLDREAPTMTRSNLYFFVNNVPLLYFTTSAACTASAGKIVSGTLHLH